MPAKYEKLVNDMNLVKGNINFTNEMIDSIKPGEKNETPINWVSLGGVAKKVYSTGQCYADWAIAIAEAIEGASYVNSGRKELR